MEDKKILGDREKLVLYAIVKNFILTANPIASNLIAKQHLLSLSSATIRNIMAELEEKGYIYQPHPSSGRIPTSAGYRIFVNQMMKKSRLSNEEKEKIRLAVNISAGDYEQIFRESSRILSQLSRQLSVLISPQLDEGIYNRMEISRLGNDRLLLVISIKSGMIKTIIVETDSDVSDQQLDYLKQLLNERLAGLKIKEIRTNFREIVSDLSQEKIGLMHLFVETAGRIFDFSENSDVFVTGTANFMRHPEFTDYKQLVGVVELLENKHVVIHLLDPSESVSDLNVLIGEEIDEVKMKNCSIIAARYKIGQVQGTLAVIGPTRMDYPHIIPLVEYTAQAISGSSE
jgi:heat-inducible transcriptional repressor